MLTRSVSASAVPFFTPSDEPPAPDPLRTLESPASAGWAPPPVVTATRPVGAVPTGVPPSFAGLAAAVEDARLAALSRNDGPPDPPDFASLRARLEKARHVLPPRFQQAVADPFLRTLDRLGAKGYARVLSEDPELQGGGRLLLDLAQAVLQRGEGYEARATVAFQEVVSDLYDGFLSAEDRRGVKPPDRGAVPPVVRWGSAADGPYTWPVTATASYGAGAAVVSLPAANASGGLLAWSALAHETAGHDILAADTGLHDELARTVRERLLAEKMPLVIADYWADRLDETASDVLGVLNMGPAAAVGLIGYFRALNGAYTGKAVLRNVGSDEDAHPADIARAYLGAETVRLLSFKGAGAWAEKLEAEADRDLGTIRLGGVAVTAGVAKASAAIVARAIVKEKLRALEGHALGEIQDWRDQDEAVVAELRAAMKVGTATAGSYAEGAYAAHVVAAAVYEAVEGKGKAAVVQDRMLAMLEGMGASQASGMLQRSA